MKAQLGSFIEVENHQKQDVWNEITGLHLHDPHRCKATSILDPNVKIMYRILTTTFWGRMESVVNVSIQDITLLFGFLRQSFMSHARYLAGIFMIMHAEKRNQTILGGAHITKLAIGLGQMIPGMQASLTVVGSISSLSPEIF